MERSTAMSLAPGTKLGPYEVVAPLGAGAMGEVYRARDPRLERDVAVKVLRAGQLADAEARRRFRSEATTLSRVNHPNVASVYDVGAHQQAHFLVMELVPGESLAERLRAGPLPKAELLPFAIQLAEGLAAAHEAEIVHRDLKPSNVRVTPEGRVKLVDFGLAHASGPAEGSELAPTVTLDVQAVGTLAYMAPEVLGGARADARADVFALGIVLYEMAVGHHPFPADTVITLLNAIANRPPVSPRVLRPDLPEGFDRVILAALEVESSRRPASARELLAELRRVGVPDARPRPSKSRPKRGARRRVRSLAVLPLDNLSGDPGQDFFADGMTEALIADLAKIEALRVISRTSAMRYKGVRRPLPEIGAELGVDAIIEGSVVRTKDRVRITVQLIHAASDTHLWAESFDRDMSDVLTLQSEAAHAIAAEIRVKVSPRTRERLEKVRRVDPAAYETYLRGRHLLNQRTEESLVRAKDHFHEAIELDPTYPLAHVGLGDVYNLFGFFSYRAPSDSFPRAKAAAQRALEIDAQTGEAHTSLAYTLLYHDWDWKGAERAFRRGLALSPSYPQASLWYLNLLVARGRHEEALKQQARCVALDPLAPIGANAEVWVRYFMRDYDGAVAAFERSRELDPRFAVGLEWGSWPYVEQGRFDEAGRLLATAESLAGDVMIIRLDRAYAHARAGDRDEARRLLEECLARRSQRHVPAYLVAFVLDALGDVARAWEWLERACEERNHWLVFLDVDPRFDRFRDDPRFGDLRRRVGV